MNERFPRPLTVGDRVRIVRAPFDYPRRHAGKTGEVTEIQRPTGPVGILSYRVKIDGPAPEYVWATEVIKLAAPEAPEAPTDSLIDLKRAQAVQVAKAILGDVSVGEIVELAAFLEGPGEATLARNLEAAAEETGPDLDADRRLTDQSAYFGGAIVCRDRSADLDAVEINGNYVNCEEIDGLVEYLQAAKRVVLDEARQRESAPF